MKKKLLIVITLIFIICCATFAQTVVRIDLRVNPSNPVISKFIYSHFAEHLGNGIYGGLYVGDSSKIANTNGVRNDVIDALVKMKIPALRWPGGCFADTYHWKDGIGPKDKRPTMINKWWGGTTENNSFGTDEFLNLCERIGAEPFICGNVGSGTVQELSDWIQYTTSDSKNPMSDLRIANGRIKPWKVQFWGVGNEGWGCGGNMRPEYYADEFRKYATFMSGGPFPLSRIASGANSDDYNWTATLMKLIPPHLIQGLALHHYSIIPGNDKGSATNFDEKMYFETMTRALLMDTIVTRHSAIMDKYDPSKRVAMVVDEWGGWYNVEPGTNPGFLFQQNTMRDAMIAAVTLNIFNNHADRIRMANLAQCINVLQAVILTKGPKLILTPTYHVMEMYNVHQDATLLPVSFISEDYIYGGQKLPAISVSASCDKSGKTHISIANIDPNQTKKVTLHFEGKKFNAVKARVLVSDKIQNFNSFDLPEKIKPVDFDKISITQGDIKIVLPKASVIVLTLN